MLTHGALFHGIGGFSLAAKWCGIPTIWECEIDEYCHKLSKQNFPEIKTRYRDIRSMTDEKNHIEPVSIISAGFPCQPFSAAGKRGGDKDDRYLWPQTIEVIKKVRPAWVVLENVSGIINMALDNVLADLEAAGYQHETFIVPAISVGAYHRRDRVWIIAHSDNGRYRTEKKRKIQKIQGDRLSDGSSKANANTVRQGLQEPAHTGGVQREAGVQRRETGLEYDRENAAPRIQWPTESPVCRAAHGIPRRVDRIKGNGNAIVPQIAAEIFRCILAAEGLG